MMIQRILEHLPIRGKGRLADAILSGTALQEVECHPIPGVTVFLRPNQRIERWMWAGAYERELVRLMKAKVERGMTVLDLGANIGYFAAIASGLVGEKGQVHAFEPMAQNFSRLEKNLSAFGWAHPYPFAAGSASGVSSIYCNRSEAGWSSLFNDAGLEAGGEVPVMRLDDWSREHKLERIDFIKIDIEGSEYRALVGAKETLHKFRPTIVIELNVPCLARDGHTATDVLDLLAAESYKCIPFGDGALAVPG